MPTNFLSVGSCPLEPGGVGGVESGGRGLLGGLLTLAGTYKVLAFSKALEYSLLELVGVTCTSRQRRDEDRET